MARQNLAKVLKAKWLKISLTSFVVRYLGCPGFNNGIMEDQKFRQALSRLAKDCQMQSLVKKPPVLSLYV